MRYTTTLSIYIFSVIFLLTSCGKEELVGDPGTPVFMAEIPFLNEETFKVVAGDELYYMFASHQAAETSMIHSGLFGKEDTCEENCGENFAIKIVQKTSVQTAQPEIGKYEYYSIPKDGFKHNFSILSTDEEALNWATWKVRNEQHFGQSITFNSNNDTAPEDGIELLYNVPGQFIVQFERAILPKPVICELDFAITRVINEGIYVELKTASPFSLVNWSNGTIGNKVLIDFSSQAYSANIFDASGCQTKVIVNFKTQNITKDYKVSLNQESFMFSTPDNSDRSVIIEYTDKAGDFYTTSVIGQILPFEFNVESIEDYENNELGHPTWKIDSSFDCILFGENGKTKRIVDGKAVFAVSY